MTSGTAGAGSEELIGVLGASISEGRSRGGLDHLPRLDRHSLVLPRREAPSQTGKQARLRAGASTLISPSSDHCDFGGIHSPQLRPAPVRGWRFRLRPRNACGRVPRPRRVPPIVKVPAASTAQPWASEHEKPGAPALQAAPVSRRYGRAFHAAPRRCVRPFRSNG